MSQEIDRLLGNVHVIRVQAQESSTMSSHRRSSRGMQPSVVISSSVQFDGRHVNVLRSATGLPVLQDQNQLISHRSLKMDKSHEIVNVASSKVHDTL